MPLHRRHALAALTLASLAPALRAQPRLRVVGVYSVPVAQPWVGRIDAALKVAAARGDIDYTVVDSVADADCERRLRELAQQGFKLIVGESFGVEAAARKVAREFPTTIFLMASSWGPQAPNYNVFDNHIQEASYLSGMVAAGVSTRARIGLVGGMPTPEVSRLMNAFIAGARDINPRCGFAASFIDSWFDPPKALAAANAMIDQGVDVLYAERAGVNEAARDRKVLTIGNVVNEQAQFPDTQVTSALWHMQPAIDEAIKITVAGTLFARNYARFMSLRLKGCELAPLGTFEGKVPAAVMDRVRARSEAMVAGSFVVPLNPVPPKGTLK